MNKLSLTICFTVLFIFCNANGYARQDSLLLYTKPDCSNCQAVKRVLQQSGIYYTEKTLDNDVYASEMLHKLSASGYHDKILLPVIFLNNKLCHPAYSSDTGLVSVPISDVVDSIRNKYRRGELNIRGVNRISTTNSAETASTGSDCELKTSTIYLVCMDYTTEAEAKSEMNKLITGGNIFAGIVYSQKKYRVFSKIFYDHTEAGPGLTETKKTYPNAYLLEIPAK
jgi:glutaredoxin